MATVLNDVQDPRSGTDAAAADFDVSRFDGPFDLLYQLLNKHKIDITDIPIEFIADQYLAIIQAADQLNMELASEFLVMAATLLQIKSRWLLPRAAESGEAEEQDPREELVMRLLVYRRCHLLAAELRQAHRQYGACFYKPPEQPARLGITREIIADKIDRSKFDEAVARVAARNQARFTDISGRVQMLLKREKVSVRDKMRQILAGLKKKARLFFHEIFPPREASRTEQVNGFLAILELIRQRRLTARQDQPFAVILLEEDPDFEQTDTTEGDVFGHERTEPDWT